ncbi:MAG: 50S ribosomal protein L19 [Planctomycetes bacterium]|nr:50S ribosomal protein L19 [Planctomycetota bacterium]
MRNRLIELAEKSSHPVSKHHFEIGDTVQVFVRIVEGDKSREQRFEGTVIRIRGAGTSATFTVRRVVGGAGIERVFPLHSPNVASVKVKGHGKIRRAKLYFLRERVGKRTKLKERIVRKVAAEGSKPRSRSRSKSKTKSSEASE